MAFERRISDIAEWLGPGTVNLFGLPYAGKDERAKQLGSYLGVQPLSSGEILRGSNMPESALAAMKRGELVPTDVFSKAVIPYLGQAAFSGKPLVLSAVGKMSGEEHGVIEAVDAAGHPTRAVPYIKITRGESIRRLAASPRGRIDDTPEALSERFVEFECQTKRVLATYESMGLLIEVNGMQEEDQVFRSMVNSLYDLARES